MRLMGGALALLAALGTAGCGGLAPAAAPSAPGGDVEQIALGWTDAARGEVVSLPHDDLIAGEEPSPRSGQTVLLNYWASTCGPCREEMPLLQHLSQRDVLVIGVTTDRFASYARRAIERAGVSYPNYRDAEAAYATSQLRGVLPLGVVPSSVVLRDGKVVKVHIGPFHSRAELDEVLEP